MPLLALFSKKGKPNTQASIAAYSNSNTSCDDDDYVSVASPSTMSHTTQPAASSSKLALPFRKKHDRSILEQQSRLPRPDPLLQPPPQRSALFQSFQDEHHAYRSTQSLPDETEQRTSRPRKQQQAASQLPGPTKKFMFSWASSKERGKSRPPTKAGSPPQESDPSFNLKSFRHVRPDSPIFHSLESRSTPPSPALPPIPTSTFPSPPVAFQVTSRRPRGNSISDLTSISSSPLASSQQKIAAGAFRQVARRSVTSLNSSDSPALPPTRTSLDDRPPPSLLTQSQSPPGTPTRPSRPQRPSNTAASTTAAPTATYTSMSASSSPLVPKLSASAPKLTTSAKPSSHSRTNAFAGSSSSSSSSEDEDEEADSTDDAGKGASRISRRRTVKQGQLHSQAVMRPPLSAYAREQIQRATPPTATSSAPKDLRSSAAPLHGVQAEQTSKGIYGAGTRPRASLSVGALSPSAKEARTSVAITANARFPNAASHATPKVTSTRLNRNPGSDTSESAESASASDEDAPLSSLVMPRRPGTSLSGHSSPSTSSPRKVLVDLNAPSSLTGRPVRAPPPLAREEDGRPKSKDPIETGPRLKPPSVMVSLGTSNSQTSQLSAGAPPANWKLSQAGSSHTTTPVGSLAPPAFRYAPNSNGGSRYSSTGTTPVAPPMRPFARRESPASSTGDSSSGKAPLTPRDGSDTRSTYTGLSSVSANGGQSRNDRRKPSVTFADEKEIFGQGKQKDDVNSEEARKERRRGEARAAIELGNVVNGPPPVDEDDLDPGPQHLGMQGAWPQGSMQIPMQMPMPAVAPMFNMGMNMPPPGGYGMNGINFPVPPPNPDPAFLAAHQQAMAIAKQTFQYAVAQQAMAAADDEWERSSNMTGFGGGTMPMPQWGYGMGMGMRQGVMFPPAPRSMYAGSVGSAGGGWGGTGSVYGNAFGPATMAVRNSTTYPAVDRPVRPRTRTAPSAAVPPAGTPVGRMTSPPSSFRGTGR